MKEDGGEEDLRGLPMVTSRQDERMRTRAKKQSSPPPHTHTQQRANKGNHHEREPTDTEPVQAKEMESWAEEESPFQQARGVRWWECQEKL